MCVHVYPFTHLCTIHTCICLCIHRMSLGDTQEMGNIGYLWEGNLETREQRKKETFQGPPVLTSWILRHLFIYSSNKYSWNLEIITSRKESVRKRLEIDQMLITELISKEITYTFSECLTPLLKWISISFH